MKLFLVSWLIIHFIIGDAPLGPVLPPATPPPPPCRRSKGQEEAHGGSSFSPTLRANLKGTEAGRTWALGRSVRGQRTIPTPPLAPTALSSTIRTASLGRAGAEAPAPPRAPPCTGTAPRPARHRPPAGRSCAFAPASCWLTSRPLAEGREA